VKIKIIEAKIFPGSKDKSALDEASLWLEALCKDGFEPLAIEVKGSRVRAVLSGQAGGSIVLVKR